YNVTKVMDFIFEFMNSKKSVTIISRPPALMAHLIISKTHRAATILDCPVSYSEEETDILFAVITNSQLNRLKRLIIANDHQPFVVMHDVNSVLGNYLI